MTVIRQKILQVLEEAERACTELILEAVRAKSQTGIELAGEATVGVRELIETLRQPTPPAAKLSQSDKPSVRSKKARISKKRAYPRFHVENEQLVKTGWSKKAKKEYVHKLPREVYEQLLDVISEYAAKTSGPFPADDIVRAGAEQEEPIPGYQVYLALAFLQQEGIVHKDGRRGYTVADSVKETGLNAWKKRQTAHSEES